MARLKNSRTHRVADQMPARAGPSFGQRAYPRSARRHDYRHRRRRSGGPGYAKVYITLDDKDSDENIRPEPGRPQRRAGFLRHAAAAKVMKAAQACRNCTSITTKRTPLVCTLIV